MAKSPLIHRWRIAYHNGGINVTIGYVKAPDEDTAMERAIEKYEIDARLVDKLIAKKITYRKY
jgi:hypothetical protein